MDYQQRSHAGVMTIAVLQLVFGALGLLCDVLGLVGQAASFAPGGGQNAAIEKDVEAALPYHKPVSFVFLGVDFVLSILMLASGVGLVQRQPWSLPVTRGYAILSIINRLIYTAYQAFFLMPVMSDVMAKHGGAGGQAAAGFVQMGMGIGVFIGFLFILYPIIVLIVMARPDVKAALGVGSPPPDSPPDYDDRDRGPFGDVPPDDRYRQPPDDRLTT
jgi:hypothetical protein